MRIPSLTFVWNEAVCTLKRFPEVLFVAFSCMSLWVYIVANDSSTSTKYLMPYLLSLSLGIGLLFCLTLVRERYFKRNLLARVLLDLGGALLLILHVLFFEKPLEYIYYYRFAQTILIVHLLCAIAPSFKGTVGGFWQYNRILFLRFLLSALYTGTLYAGLVAALGLGQYLLGFKYDKLYLNLFWVLAYGFNTWFFLAGVPTDFDELDRSEEYPVGLKRFVQFVLLPLTTLYLFILYLYLGRVIVVGELPKGQVGILVSSISILGIFCLLLLHPLAKRTENRWIPLFSKAFYVLLLPLLGLLFVGIWRRVSDYGFTEDRYLLFVMGLWLLSLCLYFTLSKRKDIRAVPLTLAFVAFVVSWGPLNSFSVGERSQWARLNRLFATHGVKDAKDLSQLPGDAAREVHATVKKLAQYPGAARLKEVFPKISEPVLPTSNQYTAEAIADQAVGDVPSRPAAVQYSNLRRNLANGISLSPRSLVLTFDAKLPAERGYALEGKTFFLKANKNWLSLTLNGKEISRVKLSDVEKANAKLIEATFKSSLEGYSVKPAPALFQTQTLNAAASVEWVFLGLDGKKEKGNYEVTGVSVLVTATFN